MNPSKRTTHQGGHEPQTDSLRHCRKHGWLPGDCKRLACARCGHMQLVRYRQQVRIASEKHAKIFFITFYFDWRKRADFQDMPLFQSVERDEKIFRVLLAKIMRALRDKARRIGEEFEYVAVLALGRFNHRIHRRVHSHVLCTFLPLEDSEKECSTGRLECRWLAEKCNSLSLIGWIEIPRHLSAVVNYTISNLETVIGKPEFAGLHTIRFSQGYKK